MGKIHDRFKSGLTHRGALGTGAVALRAVVASQNETPRRKTMHDLEEWEIHNAFQKTKYIVAEHPDLGEVALTFPNFLVHAEMAERVFRGLRIVSAGFFDIFHDRSIRIHGRSESLNIDSRAKEDPVLIARSLGL